MHGLRRLALGLSCIVLIGCEREAPEQSQLIAYPPIVRPIAPSGRYPNGATDVWMGEVTLRVLPEQGRVSRDGIVTVPLSWPEFDFVRDKKFRSSDRQDFIDKVEVFILPPNRRPRDGGLDQQAEEHRQKKLRFVKIWESSWVRSDSYPNFLLSDIASSRYFKPADRELFDPMGLPVQIGCQSYRPDLDWENVDEIAGPLPNCGYSMYWPDGHKLQIQFRRKHIRDGFAIYEAVLALHDSLIINYFENGE